MDHKILILLALPALGNCSGGALAEWRSTSKNRLNYALHAASGIILSLGQILADIPEGFATIANFRDKGVVRAKRLLISASFFLPVVGSAVVAYVALKGRSENLKMAGLVFVAGLYLLAAMEDMMREAHESAEDSRWSALSLLINKCKTIDHLNLSATLSDHAQMGK